MLAGTVEHGDSLGNKGKMGAGDVQWMTAGSGILHQEMPKGDPQGRMHGFQLWANLPSHLKMTDPRYQDIPAKEIPEIVDDDGTRVRVITGDFWGKKGPVEGVAADPRYLDIFVPPGKRKTLPVEVSRHAFAYVFDGSGTFGGASQPFGVLTEKATANGDTLVREQTGNRSLVVFDRGDEVTVQAGERRHPVPAGVRETDRGAGRLVRADRDEHQGRAAAGGERAAERHVHQASAVGGAPYPSPEGGGRRGQRVGWGGAIALVSRRPHPDPPPSGKGCPSSRNVRLKPSPSRRPPPSAPPRA